MADPSRKARHRLLSARQNTLKISKILNKYDLHGTFFVNGKSLKPKRSSNWRRNTRIIKRLTKTGHVVGVAPWDKDFDWKTTKARKALAAVRKSAVAIQKIIGYHPVYVHVPKGRLSKSVYKRLTRKGYYLISWNTSLKDGGKKLKKYHRSSSSGKSYISYQHDTKSTAKTLRKMIKKIEKKNYRFTKLKKCIGADKLPYITKA